MATEKQIDSITTDDQKYRHRKSKAMYLDRDVFHSEAWMKLTATAIRVYLLFLDRRRMMPIQGGRRRGKQFEIANNGEIAFTYDEAKEDYGISSSTFCSALDRLVETGFIDITYHGSGLRGDNSTYAITERWRLYGTDKFVRKNRPKRNLRYGFTKGNTLGKNSNK